MKILKKYSVLAMLLVSSLASAATVTLINHTSGVLRFKINIPSNIGTQYTPGLKRDFTLHKNKSITTTVLSAGTECADLSGYSNPSTYITVRGDRDNRDGYFAVGLVCNHLHLVEVSTFMGKHIAYSSDKYPRQDNVLIFSDSNT